MSLYRIVLRPVLFALDAEHAHNVTLGVLSHHWVGQGLRCVGPLPRNPSLGVEAFGLSFDNPLGLAAGLDKHGTAVPAWRQLAFGFVEVGTVTPLPQPGNPRPRLFRLPQDDALINRFGFNSVGARQVAANLEHTPSSRVRLGINLGKNRDTPNDRAADDYVAAVDILSRHTEYFVVNVSSPNTVGLRDLQQARTLRLLVEQVVSQASRAAASGPVPVLVKLSPDMSDTDLLHTADAAIEGGAAGLVATNTTTSRNGLSSPESLTRQEGGLSGAPLRARASSVCRLLYRHVGPRVPIVGVGGIGCAETAYERIRSGATLLQLYSALIYGGPTLPKHILTGLGDLLARDGLGHLSEAIGVDA